MLLFELGGWRVFGHRSRAFRIGIIENGRVDATTASRSFQSRGRGLMRVMLG